MLNYTCWRWHAHTSTPGKIVMFIVLRSILMNVSAAEVYSVLHAPACVLDNVGVQVCLKKQADQEEKEGL